MSLKTEIHSMRGQVDLMRANDDIAPSFARKAHKALDQAELRVSRGRLVSAREAIKAAQWWISRGGLGCVNWSGMCADTGEPIQPAIAMGGIARCAGCYLES